jgi:hypothetical protein
MIAARSLLLLSLLFAGACLPDRGESSANARLGDAGSDAAVTTDPPPYECRQTTMTAKDGLAGFASTTPYDYAVKRREHRAPAGYRFPETTNEEEWGTPSATAKERIDALRYCDAEKCPDVEMPYELRGNGAWSLYCYGTASVGGAPAPGYYIDEIVVANGDEAKLLALRSELLDFFGRIDTKSEAVYLAMRDGFSMAACQWDAIVETDDGFDLTIPVRGSCERAPGGPTDGSAEEIVLHVGRDGATRIDSRRTLPRGTIAGKE